MQALLEHFITQSTTVFADRRGAGGVSGVAGAGRADLAGHRDDGGAWAR